MRKLLLLLVSLALVGACVFNVPPPLPPVDPPRESHISVFLEGRLVADQVTFATLTPEPTGVALDVLHWFDGPSPRLKVILPANVPYGWGAWLRLEGGTAFEPFLQRVTIAPDINVEVQSHPVTGEYGPVTIEGDHFLRSGQPWRARGASSFLLFARYARGEDVRGTLAWMVDHRRNFIRFFAGGVGWTADPNYCTDCGAWSRYPDLSTLPAWFDLLRSYGIVGEATVVTGADRSLADWRAILQTVYDAAAGRGDILVEVTNESWTRTQDLAPHIVIQGIERHGVLTAYGNQGGNLNAQGQPIPYDASLPHGDYITLHTQRDVRGAIGDAGHFAQDPKDALELRWATRRPVLDDEPLGFASYNREGAGARTTDMAMLSSHFGLCALFANGCTWHFQSGLFGRIPEPGTLESQIADSLVAIDIYFPSRASVGGYARAGLGDFGLAFAPGDSRVNHAYGTILALNPSVQYVVVPLVRPGWTPRPVNGWSIASFGPFPGQLTLVK